jgi:UDP-GlcNAc:undecaprenyl-phosphate/decaprenyl-phosphate GlcNAc-1-phosphate transferase
MAGADRQSSPLDLGSPCTARKQSVLKPPLAIGRSVIAVAVLAENVSGGVRHKRLSLMRMLRRDGRFVLSSIDLTRVTEKLGRFTNAGCTPHNSDRIEPLYSSGDHRIVEQYTIALLGTIVAFFITLLLQRLLVPVATHLDLLDYPAGRKDHLQPTPIIGGIAMLAGVLLASAFTLHAMNSTIFGFLGAAALLVFVGLLDDKYDLDWRLRILAQMIAALIMIYIGGVRVHYLGHLFGYENVFLGSLSVPFTVFATVGIINAINMVDGMDGLAGLLVLSALAMLSVAALYSGNYPVFSHALIAIGAVWGFLLYNIRHPWQSCAKSFMGNAGSTFLGLTIAWIAFRLTQNPGHPVTPVLALWMLPIPVMDCLVLIVRRLKLGQSPFRADRNHIHHLMLDAGFTPTRAAFTLAAFSCACGLLAAIASRAHISHNYLLGAFFVMCGIWYWITSRRARAIAFFGGGRTTEEPTKLACKEVP